MAERTREEWARKRWRIAGLALIVLVVEAIGIAWGVAAVAMNLIRIGEVWLAVRWGIGGRDAFRRWSIVFLALAALEVVLLVAGAYVGLVWTIRIFVYPMALLFTTPRGGEIRFAWIWAATLGVMLLAFLMQKALASGSPGWIWASRGLAAAVAGVAVVFVDRVWKALVSLKFATVCLTLLTMLCIVGTLVVQRPAVDPDQYPEKFAAGQVGFLVNAEIKLGMVDVPEPDLDAQAGRLRAAFGEQVAADWLKKQSRAAKNDRVGHLTDERAKANEAAVTRLRHYLDDIRFTSMFKSWAFNSLLVLIALSLLGVLVKKWPWGRLGWGAPVAHAGVVALLLGVTVSDLTVKEGMLRMTLPGPRSIATGFLDSESSREGTWADAAGFDAALARIREDLGRPVAVSFMRPGSRDEGALESREDGDVWQLRRAAGPPLSGEAARNAIRAWNSGRYQASRWVDLPFRLRMTEGYDDHYRELRITARAEDGGTVEQGFPVWEGEEIPLFDGRYTAEILEFHDHARVAGGEPKTVVRTLPAEPGTKETISTPVGDYRVEVLDVAADYAQHEQKVPLEQQEEKNPAVRVRVVAPGGAEETVWIFEKFPGFYREGAMGKKNPHVGVNDLVVEKRDGARTLVLTLPAGRGNSLLTDEAVTPVRVLPGEIPEPGLQSVVKIRLIDGSAKGGAGPVTRWLRLAQRLDQDVTAPPGRDVSLATLVPPGDPQGWLDSADGRVRIRLYQTLQPSIYETHVEVLGPQNEVLDDHVIRVNEPLSRQGFRFYQSTYYEIDGRPFTGLTVKYDAGIPVIYFGFLVMMVGILAAFLLRPLKRRADARAKEEFGREIRNGMGF